MSIQKLFKSRSIILEMAGLRGYDVEPYSTFSINEIEVMFKNSEKKTSAELGSLDMTMVNKLGSKMYFKYLLASKLRVNNFRTLIGEMLEGYIKSGDELIFVVKDRINNMDGFNSLLDTYLTSHNVFIQIFCLDNLLFNITRHNLVPEMAVVSPETREQLLEKYSLTPKQVPQILKSDPHAKFLGVRKGDMCKITRASETAGSYVTYRMCLQ